MNISLPQRTVFFQKPDAIDTPKYEKPNAYDEDPPTITASRNGSHSSKMTVDSFTSRYFKRREPTIISTLSNNKGFAEVVSSPPTSPVVKKEPVTSYHSQIDFANITAFILSQPTLTTQTNFGHHHEEEYNSYYAPSSSPTRSLSETLLTSPNALLVSNDSGIVSSFLQQKKSTIKSSNKKSSLKNNIVYNFKKASIDKPNQHHIFLHIDHPDEEDEEVMVYRKVQPYSYTWGFQSMLYSNRNDGQGIKVAEARRRAFQKDIVIESADYEHSEIEDITQPYIYNLKNTYATSNIHSQDLIKRSQSNILFEYEIWFHGSRMRWKRPSLLSPDFTCEIKLTRQETKLLQQTKAPKKKKKKNNSLRSKIEEEVFIDSDSDNDEDDHDNHTHKNCRRWKLLAEFDSDTMNYLSKEYGKLSIDLDILNQVEKDRCDLLEANIVMTCCTLIGLIRDIMGNVVIMYLICKVLYIAIFALLSAAPPYLPLYYHDVLGFSSDQIGFVLAIAPFIQSIACPLWTYTVDKRPALHGPIMAITSLIGGSAIMTIMVIGNSVSSDIVNPTQIFSTLKLQLSNSSLVLVTSALALTFAFFTLPNLSLVDSAVMKILGPNKILYGEQRLWGSVSAGATILIVGQIISMTGSLDGLFWVFGASTLLFIVFSCFVNVSHSSSEYEHLPQNADEDAGLERVPSDGRLLSQVMTDTSEKLLSSEGYRVPMKGYSSISHSNSHYVDLFKPNSTTSAHTIREEADETLEAIGGLNLGLAISRIASVDQPMIHIDSEGIPPSSMFKSVRVVTFLITTLLFGFVLSMIVNFLFLFLSRDLMMPASWIGWTGPTTGVTELLCFCFSKQLTEIFGVTNMILIAHVATIVRCLIYTVLTPDSFFTNVSALSLQTLHGIGFGIFWATSVSEMDGFFPPEQRSVAQGILGALHFGLGAGLGALSGGYLYEYMGAIWMFRIGALVATINMVIFYVGRLDRFNK
ncbi:hypothetical protein HPULCUR_003490 [Helicostylum pulchrum]|uniref:Major facilitator superfamily (MFS) profile domain-containing protein n=1 Tax=Helicostylum pulchrum TaxID=562976 RepID=A0ABP9XTJ2_9FUNG